MKNWLKMIERHGAGAFVIVLSLAILLAAVVIVVVGDTWTRFLSMVSTILAVSIGLICFVLLTTMAKPMLEDTIERVRGRYGGLGIFLLILLPTLALLLLALSLLSRV